VKPAGVGNGIGLQGVGVAVFLKGREKGNSLRKKMHKSGHKNV
jgi:hypothetical protein